MAYSYVSYTGDGTTRDFIVPFPYLYQADVHITVNDEDASAACAWLNASAIQFLSAPAQGSTVRMQRLTNKVAPEVDFRNGSTLTEADLDLAVTQLLYIAQEAYDALDGETAVAAKDEAKRILAQVRELYGKTEAEIDYFRKMYVVVHSSATAPGHADYDFATGRLNLYIPRGEQGERGPQGPPPPQGATGPKGPMGDSPLPLTFGNFRVSRDGHLEFEYNGALDEGTFNINHDTGELEVTLK